MEELQVYYDKDANLDLVLPAQVAVVGYGSQGHAHALNLRDSGVSVKIGLHAGSQSAERAKADGFEVLEVAEAVAASDWIVLLTPDEVQPALYREQIAPHLAQGATLLFGHGFNIHFRRIEPREDLDVIMAAPKGPGHTVRSTFKAGGGVPALVAAEQDASGQALQKAIAYASAIGAGKTGIIATGFREETETDLFGEQTVLCGGLPELILAGYETLVEAGYPPELAYFECLHETKLIVDLIYEGGLSNMFYSVSNTAEYGGGSVGPKIIDESVRERMREALGRIRRGEFAREFASEHQSGQPVLKAHRRHLGEHPIEKVGVRLRGMMQAVFGERLVRDSEKG